MTEWCQTASGLQAFITDPTRTEIRIEGIAAHLSRICRFNGALRSDVPFYSVAQHSVLVSQVCKAEHALIGLLHDASEAYVQDIIRPLKTVLKPLYAPIEHEWSLHISHSLGLGHTLAYLPDNVKRADELLLATERRDVMSPCDAAWTLDAEPLAMRIHSWDPATARELFLLRFHELVGGRA